MVTLPVLKPHSCDGAVLLEPPLDNSVNLFLASLNTQNSARVDPSWECRHSRMIF